jgi:hypothetical protein
MLNGTGASFAHRLHSRQTAHERGQVTHLCQVPETDALFVN